MHSAVREPVGHQCLGTPCQLGAPEPEPNLCLIRQAISGVTDPPHIVGYDPSFLNGGVVETFDDGTRFTSTRSNDGFWVSVIDVDTLGQT